MRQKKENRSFTFIELIMIMVIIGITSMIIAPKIVNSLNLHNFDNEIREMFSNLKWMQQKAITEHKNYGMEVDNANDCYSVGQWNGASFVPSETTCFQYAEVEGNGYLSPPYTVYFNHLGIPENHTGSVNDFAFFQMRYIEQGQITRKYIQMNPNGAIRLHTL